MQRPRDDFQTDALRPAALPTAQLRGWTGGEDKALEETSDEYLDAVYDEWNKKVDVEVDTLVDGMAALVHLASVSHNQT